MLQRAYVGWGTRTPLPEAVDDGRVPRARGTKRGAPEQGVEEAEEEVYYTYYYGPPDPRVTPISGRLSGDHGCESE